MGRTEKGISESYKPYGEVVALPDGSFSEKIFNGIGYIKNRITSPKIKLEQEIHPGIFSCSNALARSELLRRYPFSEALGNGGEDVEVAYRIIKAGFYIANVPELLVMHRLDTQNHSSVHFLS